jgi:hypothetical protein
MSGDEIKRFVAKTGSKAQLEKSLKFIKGLDAATEASARTLTNTIKGENFAKLITRYVDTPAELTDIIFKKLGDVAVSPEAIKIAMAKSPEALDALAWWKVSLLSNPELVKGLALRSGKDAEAIEIVTKWAAGSTPTVAEIQAVARLQTIGEGKLFALGGGDYATGWPQFARVNHADFYFTNEKISQFILDTYPNSAEVFWSINKAALDGPGGPIANELDFLYQIVEANELDAKAIKKIWDGGSDEEIMRALELNTNNPLPFRMKELKVVYENDYRYIIRPDGNFVLTP